jgi:hypothetical protein
VPAIYDKFTSRQEPVRQYPQIGELKKRFTGNKKQAFLLIRDYGEE